MVFSGTRNTVFRKRSPDLQSGVFFFFKRRLIVFVSMDENGGFRKRSFHKCHIGRENTLLTIVTRWSRSTSNFYSLIGQNLTGEFMRKIYAAS